MERLADRYDLGDPLGQGRSTVFRAVDTRLRRDVAIKRVQLLAGQEDAEQVRTRALREAQASARLNNPSAVAVYDVVEEAGAIWLVMELVDGPSLAQIVADEGPVPHARAAVIGMAVLTALEAAHLVGVVHRDVKPANVVVSAGDRAKLTDFGVATIRDESRVTATGLIVGSPSYMAPEQATGGEITPATDLWALGALLYFAVEGEPPFLAGSALATASAVVHGEPRPQQHPGPLSPLLTRLFVKDPARRPTAGQVRATLARVAREARPRPAPAAASSSDPTLVAGPLPAIPPRPSRRRSAPTAASGPAPAAASEASPVPTAGAGPGVSPAETPPAGSAPAPEVSPAGAADGSASSSAGSAPAPEVSPAGAADGSASSSAVAVPSPEVAPAGAPDGPAVSSTGSATNASDPSPGGAATSDSPVSEPAAARSVAGPGAAAEAPTAPAGGRQRNLVVGAVAVLVLLLVAVVAAALPGGGDDGDPSEDASPQDEAPAATDATATTEPVATTTAAPAPPPTTAGLPAGWTLYTDPQGAYTIGLPPGWQPQPTGEPYRIDLVDPATGSLLRVEWTATPGADAVQAWRDSEGGFAARNAGYQLIGISRADYRDYPAAMWEFRHGTDPTYHTGNLGFITHGRGYALMFRTPEAQWAAGQPTFEQFKQTFQPT